MFEKVPDDDSYRKICNWKAISDLHDFTLKMIERDKVEISCDPSKFKLCQLKAPRHTHND